ncbi:MAG: hypothetical protein GY754_01615 [bacterium]|nr:hypothetical protein [bacterium]
MRVQLVLLKKIMIIYVLLVLIIAGTSCDSSIDDPESEGPYSVSSYSTNLESSSYFSARIYYPENRGEEPYAAVVVSGGYTNIKEMVSWISNRLASQGFVVLAYTPTNILGLPATWERGHNGGIEQLKEENSRYDSPIYGMVDTNKLGVIGYSNGGTGAVMAASTNDDIKAVVALCPMYTSGRDIEVPTLLITGTLDFVAFPLGVKSIYNTIPSYVDKAYLNFNGMTHFDSINWGVLNIGLFHDSLSKYFVSHFKYFLNEDEDYLQYIEEELQEDRENWVFFNTKINFSQSSL